MDIRVERCLRENSVRIELLNQREFSGELSLGNKHRNTENHTGISVATNMTRRRELNEGLFILGLLSPPLFTNMSLSYFKFGKLLLPIGADLSQFDRCG